MAIGNVEKRLIHHCCSDSCRDAARRVRGRNKIRRDDSDPVAAVEAVRAAMADRCNGEPIRVCNCAGKPAALGGDGAGPSASEPGASSASFPVRRVALVVLAVIVLGAIIAWLLTR